MTLGAKPPGDSGLRRNFKNPLEAAGGFLRRERRPGSRPRGCGRGKGSASWVGRRRGGNGPRAPRPRARAGRLRSLALPKAGRRPPRFGAAGSGPWEGEGEGAAEPARLRRPFTELPARSAPRSPGLWYPRLPKVWPDLPHLSRGVHLYALNFTWMNTWWKNRHRGNRSLHCAGGIDW